MTAPLATLLLLSAAKQPNVVFILVDDLGYADVGAFGSKEIRTPHIDRLARDGARLTQCYAGAPVCTPTRASFITGLYPARTGLEWALQRDERDPGLKPTDGSLPRLLKNAGYATGMFGKWHLGFKPEFSPNAHGFDEFFGMLGGSDDMYAHRGVTGEPDLYENGKLVEREGYLTDLFAERAAAFIDAHKAGPFFLYLPFNAVHFPFQAPGKPNQLRTAETWQSGGRKDYVAMMERVDWGIGLVMKALERNGLGRDTLVLFTSDNGGDRLSDNGALFHHKATLWEGGIRVPCIARWPGVVAAGSTSAQPAITMDFTASILAAAGVSAPRKLDGIDLVPVLARKSKPAPRTLYWRITGVDRKQKAVRMGPWKYIREGEGTTARKELLFDVERDPSERRELGYKHPEMMPKLRQLMADWEAELAKNPPPFQLVQTK